MNMNALYAAIVALVALIAFRRITGVKQSSPESVLEKLKAGALLIDVRTREEFAAGSHRKAKSVPLADLPSRVEDLKSMDKPIIVFCASGSRSSQAAKLLKKAGITEVLNAGGIHNLPRA